MNEDAWQRAWRADVGSTQRLVLVAFANEADERGEARISTSRLMEMTRLSERQVRRTIRDLAFAGHVTRYEARGRGVITRVHPR